MANKDVYIFEVSQKNFESTVVENSHKIPVVVEFMGVWSAPCIELEEYLSSFATEFAGQFIFAKVDVDEHPELAKEYSVENTPCVKVFKNGEIVQSEERLMNPDELRVMLKSHGIFRESDEMRKQARLLHLDGKTIEAITLLTQLIQKDPSNTLIAMDMVQIFIDIGELEQATGLFNKLPNKDKESDIGKSLVGQLTFRRLASETEGKEVLSARIANDASDYDAHFDLAVCAISEHDYEQAMQHLFHIFSADPEYKEGAAKEMIINLTNMLEANAPELAQQCRRQLSSMLA